MGSNAADELIAKLKSQLDASDLADLTIAKANKRLSTIKAEIATRKSLCKAGPKGCTTGRKVVKRGLCEAHLAAQIDKENKARVGRITECEDGYLRTYDENGKFRLLHRLVMETKLGRPLSRSEKVIFLDGNRMNCEPENLTIQQGGTITCPHCNESFEVK